MTGLTATTFGLDGWMEKALLVAITLAIAVVLFAFIRALVPRAERRAAQSEDPAKWQQRRTAVTLLATVLRYTILLIALITVIVILAGAGGIAALGGGGALLVLIVGFSTQRFLTDVIAGFFILFEGQYAVGDVITIQPGGATGIVESLGVRATVLYLADGSHVHVANGQISVVTRHRSAQTSVLITAVTRDVPALRAGVADIARTATGTGEIIGTPYDEEVIEMASGVHTVRTTVRVPSARLTESLDFLRAMLPARLGDDLLGDPLLASVPYVHGDLIGPAVRP